MCLTCLVLVLGYQARNNPASRWPHVQAGTLPANNPVAWRANSLTYEASSQYGFADLTGGWITGGATGNIKMTQPIAFSTAMLAWGMLSFTKGFSSGGESNTAAALENVEWGADYLMKTFRPGNAAQTVADGYTIVYQVPAAPWQDLG